jgi:hypothetical protein
LSLDRTEFLHDITNKQIEAIATHGGKWLEAYIDFKLHLSKSRTSLEAYFNFKFNFSKSRTSFCKLEAYIDFKFHLSEPRTSY